MKFRNKNTREIKEFDCVRINSALLSAQNRVRLYWCNWKVEQPEDRGILLKDILEDAGEIHQRPRGKNKGGIHTEKSPTLTANKWEDNNKLCLGGAIRGRYTQTGQTKQRLEINGTEKANSLTTVQKDSLCVQVGTANIKGFDIIKRVYSPDGKSPTLTTMGGGHREPKVEVREKSKCVRSSGLGSYDRHEWDSVGDKGTPLYWRKLTTTECERLQTLKDCYTAIGNYNGVEKQVSNSQRYRALGNGWTVEVIKHIYHVIIT